ncbi:Alpha/Beta hydrolase protein [Poronia punctata]|nr:Alpha/Beta hydrolase protein [Poronia punctata]
MAEPGSLFVTMQPKSGLALEQFHEWYNNEHGPTRLQLAQIFTNGLRYRALDGQEPAFLAAYDVTRMSHLETETYTRLRAGRSVREADTIGQVDVTRYFWDLVLGRSSPEHFRPVEQLADEEAEGLVLVAVQLTPRTEEGADAEEEIKRWYEEEHIDMLSKVPGWLRSRLFKTSSLEKDQPTKFIALHDYAKINGLAGPGPELKAATSTPWAKELLSKHATVTSRRVYELFYVFGPAPRDLHNLSLLPPAKATFKSPDGKTTTSNDGGEAPVIESRIVTTKDGLLSIPYRLEGNPDPHAPTIAFCNSLLTSLHMWDAFVGILKEKRPGYRILRYDFRGRNAGIPARPATLDMLADDLAELLAALRIQKLHVLVGVSMGGATTLKFALRHPERVAKFVACDFNVASSEANTNAWKQRIAVAESATSSSDGVSGMETLATQTVSRWFHPDTVSFKLDVTAWVRDMVAANDVEGFRFGCQALWDYDMKEEMKKCVVPGLLVVGEEDGKGALVKAMDGFKDLVGEKGAGLMVVPKAGHLPMCEQPEGFWEAVEKFL